MKTKIGGGCGLLGWLGSAIKEVLRNLELFGVQRGQWGLFREVGVCHIGSFKKVGVQWGQ